ncbi:von_Willebrand factor type A domain-containing protein [Hexamita inflata]|uniref:von Willebrand factor type A domain-containing protein n=1 Tax=Hexamita inflata TaxID=28002 RepID=A0AA86QGH7_9EUKA|nr:von Willebrand factor type A domain-containing protein [Hexamita inflata]
MLMEVISILDMSDSMSGLTNQTISYYNTYLEKLRMQNNEIYLTLIVFNTQSKIIYEHVNINSIQNNITSEIYNPEGESALNDAIGTAITRTQQFIRTLKRKNAPKKVQFFIITSATKTHPNNIQPKKQGKLSPNAKRTNGSSHSSHRIQTRLRPEKDLVSRNKILQTQITVERVAARVNTMLLILFLMYHCKTKQTRKLYENSNIIIYQSILRKHNAQQFSKNSNKMIFRMKTKAFSLIIDNQFYMCRGYLFNTVIDFC